MDLSAVAPQTGTGTDAAAAAAVAQSTDDADAASRGSALDARFDRLAASHTRAGVGARRHNPAGSLHRVRAALDQAWQALRSRPGAESRAAEWLLDNAWLIGEAIDLVREALPAHFVRWLPRLDSNGGERRVVALARELIDAFDGYLDPARLTSLVSHYQRTTPLTTAELWALPAVLRLIVLEQLAAEAARLTGRAFPPPLPSLPHGVDDAGVRVGALVEDLRILDIEDWKRFFERVSPVERVLRQDPVGAYSEMDFDTRDRYRKAVEELARHSDLDEIAVAQLAVRLATGAAPPPYDHVGYYLVDDGRRALERATDFHSPIRLRLSRLIERGALGLYLSAIAVTTLGLATFIAVPAYAAGPLVTVVALLLSILPASAVGVALVNWAVTRLVTPRPLPKLEIRGDTPHSLATAVVVPVLLTDPDEIHELLAQLERNFHANAGLGLRFALLTDFIDASAEHLPGDEALLDLAENGVLNLNRRHAAMMAGTPVTAAEVKPRDRAVSPDGAPSPDGTPQAARSGPGRLTEAEGPFLLIHRARRWNPAQGCWMGWERKRGKLSQFNRLVLGQQSELEVRVGNASALRSIRYAITLDADTFLPPETARRLIGTAAHPLNRPVLNDDGRAVRGYTVFQPRIEVILPDRPASPFARIMAGDRGLDLYSRAVSDVYQDLFAEGSFAGKGLYEIAAFERSVTGRIPENALLSHDLFEGAHGRSALVSDVTVLEDYPYHVLGYMRRLHRWIRGDWQIAPWLRRHVRCPAGRLRNRLSLLDRWKIADNLRRSLVEPSILVLLIADWFFLPGPALWWTAAAAAIPGLAFILGTVSAARGHIRLPRRWVDIAAVALAFTELERWLLSLVLLPYHSLVACDAIVRTLVRLRSGRRLLEWKSAAAVAHQVSTSRQREVWRQMLAAPLFAAALAAALLIDRPYVLPVATPFLVGWLASPWLAWWVSHIRLQPQRPLSADQRAQARKLARSTWAYFETILGPEDHWLPIDHVQEEPWPRAARRTSPTNAGLATTATLAAWDLGYIPVSRLTAILLNMFDTFDRLERYRGHFLNWYGTRDLSSLRPRYVSTVDSGNLACALTTVARGCEQLLDQSLPRTADMNGLRDTMTLVVDAIRQPGIRSIPGSQRLLDGTLAIVELLKAASTPGPATCAAMVSIARDRLPDLESATADLAETEAVSLDPLEVAWLRTALHRARQHASLCVQERFELMPWLDPDLAAPKSVTALSGAAAARWHQLRAALPNTATLRNIPAVVESARTRLVELESALDDASSAAHETAAWTARLAPKLESAASRANELARELETIVRRADTFIAEMDFASLYDRDRHLFHVGYDVDTGRVDGSYYDLLTSEARLASFIAMAKGDVPAEHWLHLSRPFSRAGRNALMLSWGGTMFEYLMPSLFLRCPGSTLLSFACRAAVREQKLHAARKGLPWGVSESAFHQVDRQGTYQYRAFGIPSLALRREPADREVVAPYASALALAIDPHDALDNLRAIARLGAMGRYGMFEAVDFDGTAHGVARSARVVRSWMAHHQAMILLALDNLLRSDTLVRRFHSDPRIAAVEYVILERLPGEARLEPPPPAVRPARLLEPHVDSGLWRVEPGPEIPHAQVLSNGRWSTLITDRGSGNARWLGLALTRWRNDPALDDCGTWLCMQDLESGDSWCPTHEPEPTGSAAYEVLFGTHRVEFRHVHAGVRTLLAVFVPPAADVEVRQLTITNPGQRSRHIAVTSFAEVALALQTEDRRHPAFSKLFVESRILRETDTLLFRRRQGSADEFPVHLAHTLTTSTRRAKVTGWETDRSRFLGRDGSIDRPRGLTGGPAGLSGTTGSTLDPILALGAEIELRPGEDVVFTFLTAAGRTPAAALAQLEPFRSPARTAGAMREALESRASELGALGMSESDARLAQTLLTALVYPYHPLRAPAGPVRPPRQNALWGLGISGDVPVIAVRVSSAEQKPALMRILRAHAFLRGQCVQADLLVLAGNDVAGGYVEPLAEWLGSAVRDLHGDEAWQQTGGVFHVPLARLDADTATSVAAAAAVSLDAGMDFDQQLDRARATPARLPRFVPVPSAPLETAATPPLEPARGLLFDNGHGGFTPDGREYVITVEPGRPTPAPWINVLANADFGCTISESGGGFTWAGDSGRHRLTPWRNDPVLDVPGEVVYLRDEENGEIWSATPEPAPAGTRYEIRHTAGLSSYQHCSNGLDQKLEVFVPVDAPLKVARIDITNMWQRQRRLTVTYYAELVLGSTADISAPHVVTEFAPEAGAILARQHFSDLASGAIAFLAASEHLHGATADRAAFLGRGGLEEPAGLQRIGLADLFGSGLDPCAVVQVHLDLAPGQRASVHFLLGQESSRERALDLISRFRPPETVQSALDEVRSSWDERLGRIRVDTPEPAMNLALNRWLPYQALACRLHARSALYQSSGAFGFRDQLQDVLGFLMTDPDMARRHILEAASRQFAEGDVLHWWHPGTTTGVRTRCSDDMLWLPFVTAAWVEATGDASILDETVPFLSAAELSAAEHERYDTFPVAAGTSPLYDHCRRAIARGTTRGAHGLPLIGANDWNDGFDHVGNEGRGESVWLGWFLHSTLEAFAPLCQGREGDRAAAGLRAEAERLRAALDAEAWDGDWYRRAWYDDGSPLGSASRTEARIDSLSQSWAVLSHAAPEDRARKAMAAVRRELLDQPHGLLRLLAPPFDRGAQQPGYIRAYPPGVRENGAQYTHAAVWAAWALALTGEPCAAAKLFELLDPIARSGTAEDIARYRVEPFVVAADIYDTPDNAGRGGWTWYTGSAAWLYRFGIECVLGLQRRGAKLWVDPRIPFDWKWCDITIRHANAVYRIRIENPADRYDGVEQVSLDGSPLEGIAIPLLDEGEHNVVVRLGTRSAARPWSPALW